jgi:hypothetical protein
MLNSCTVPATSVFIIAAVCFEVFSLDTYTLVPALYPLAKCLLEAFSFCVHNVKFKVKHISPISSFGNKWKSHSTRSGQ